MRITVFGAAGMWQTLGSHAFYCRLPTSKRRREVIMEWKKWKALFAGLAFGLAAAATLSHAQLLPSRFVNLPGQVSRGEKGESRG
jgi:hypothetical protein